MLDEFDYKEPSCALCGAKEFYYPKDDAPKGLVPVDRVLAKIDACFEKNDYTEAGRLLEYWYREADALNDKNAKLTISSELVGYYRKINDKDNAYKMIDVALTLVKVLGQEAFSSGGTVYLNCATAYKAFGDAEKAIPLYQKTLIVYRDTLDEKDALYGGLYNNWALALVDLKEYEKAEEAYYKAVEIMQNVDNGEADLAITYVNLAHLYEKCEKPDKITDCMYKAYRLLNAESLPKNGYYAFVLEKCAPSFGHFGYTFIKEELEKTSREIYARA